jgi:hypothetical protein
MRGDREAFGVLVVHTSDRMYAIATRILRDAELAEDALQSALLTAWRQLPTLRDPDRFEPGSGACSSTRATPRPGAGAHGRQTCGSCRSTDRQVRTCSSALLTVMRSIGRSDA